MRKRQRNIICVATVLLLSTTTPSISADEAMLIFCAPGYPGDTEQAAPTMELVSRAVEKHAGLDEGTLSAVYHEREDAGKERIASKKPPWPW